MLLHCLAAWLRNANEIHHSEDIFFDGTLIVFCNIE